MKHLPALLLLICALRSLVLANGKTPIAAAETLVAVPAVSEIAVFELDHTQVTVLPVSSADVTMITFPSPITGIMGAWIGDGSNAEAPIKFQAQHPKGSNFIAVRNVVKGQTAALSVLWQGKVYVIRLIESHQPVLSAIFKERTPPPRAISVADTLDPNNPANTPRFEPKVGLSLLDRALLYPVLKQQLPEKVQDVEFRKIGTETTYPNVSIRLTEAYRFSREDGLVFHIDITNKTHRELYFSPQSLGVRVGEHVYYQQVASASGVIPPNGTTKARFAIVGTPDGSRNDISIKNHFTPVVSVTDRRDSEFDLILGEYTTALKEAVQPERKR